MHHTGLVDYMPVDLNYCPSVVRMLNDFKLCYGPLSLNKHAAQGKQHALIHQCVSISFRGMIVRYKMLEALSKTTMLDNIAGGSKQHDHVGKKCWKLQAQRPC